MKINANKRTAYCFWCNKEIELKDIYLHVLYEGSITCDKNHLIGNESDEEWTILVGGIK
jgi:hypothetical protein